MNFTILYFISYMYIYIISLFLISVLYVTYNLGFFNPKLNFRNIFSRRLRYVFNLCIWRILLLQYNAYRKNITLKITYEVNESVKNFMVYWFPRYYGESVCQWRNQNYCRERRFLALIFAVICNCLTSLFL